MSDLLTVLNAAKAEDLAEIEAKIEEATRELDGLKTIRKILAVRINGKPERMKKTQDDMTEKSQAIYDLIVKEGSLPAVAIAGRLGIRQQAVTMTVRKSPWLTVGPTGDVEIKMSEG